MDDDKSPIEEPANLRFLRRLVTLLTGVMIAGLVTITVLLVIRLSQPASGPLLPDTLILPENVEATAVTAGDGWFAVVDRGSAILIFDTEGALLKRIEIKAR